MNNIANNSGSEVGCADCGRPMSDPLPCIPDAGDLSTRHVAGTMAPSLPARVKPPAAPPPEVGCADCGRPMSDPLPCIPDAGDLSTRHVAGTMAPSLPARC